MTLKYIVGKFLLKIPVIRYKQFVYEILGVNKHGENSRYFMGNPKVVGEYSNLLMHDNSEIERNCFILAKAKIEIGKNTTLAYGVTILTGADPNGPRNKLSDIYPPVKAPVIIGNDCWIGANSVILPGVTIGNCSVVAAGTIVTKDVPSGVLVAGNPGKVKKNLKINYVDNI